MASIVKFRNKYYIAYRLNGKRTMTNTKLAVSKNNLSKARKIKKEIEDRIENIFKDPEVIISNILSPDKNISFSEAIDLCIEERIKGKTHTHLRNFNISMNHFLKVLPSDILIGEINSGHIVKFINLLKPIVANATMHNYIRYVKILFNYLVDEDYLIKSPIKKKLIPKLKRKNIVIFNKADLEDILKIAKERDPLYYNCLMMLLLTGLRPVDLIRLKISDFEFSRKQINVRISKTGKEIKFPIFDELELFIKKNMHIEFERDRTDYVFKDFSVEKIGRRFRRIKKVLMINEKYVITLKTFRTTFATGMATNGLSLQEVANLLAHDSTATTERYYADVITENLRKKINIIKKE